MFLLCLVGGCLSMSLINIFHAFVLTFFLYGWGWNIWYFFICWIYFLLCCVHVSIVKNPLSFRACSWTFSAILKIISLDELSDNLPLIDCEVWSNIFGGTLGTYVHVKWFIFVVFFIVDICFTICLYTFSMRLLCTFF